MKTSVFRHGPLIAAMSFLTVASALAFPSDPIKPGEVWKDDRGKQIQAHGGGILKVGNTFYWFGEDRSQDNERGKRYVACYASTDLTNWKFRNQVINMYPPPDIGPHMVLERPKVFYNAKTRKYVMYMHLDGPNHPYDIGSNYALARVGVATCDTVDGNYRYVNSFRPLGKESRDIGQFIDDDGTGYIIFESRPTHGFFIGKLSDDFLNVEKETCFIQAPLEGGALVHYKDLYYIIGSKMTGWDANPNKYATASKLEGPWSEFKDIAPPETKTYGAQSTMMVKIAGTKTTSVIFMGDMWNKRALWDSRYMWMPLEIGDGSLHVPTPKPFTLDVVTGEATVQP